jgi:hypothetical protein
MMRVEDSKYKDHYEKKVITTYGEFYFFKKFVIAEIAHGVHFNWELAKELIAMAYDHYGSDIRVAYISNRVNDYSVNAQDWLNFYKERHHLEAIAIVAHHKSGIMNMIMENLFTQSRLRRFGTLDEAINWVLTIKDSAEVEKTSKKDD